MPQLLNGLQCAIWILTLKMPAKNSSENSICFCCLLQIFANINKIKYNDKQCGPLTASDLGLHCLLERLLKNFSRRQKADDFCCDWQFRF